MIILTIAVALGVPRFAGDEFVLTVRWDHELAEESESAGVYLYPEVSGLLAPGRSAVGVFHPESGELLFSQRRHPAFTHSGDYYLNQVVPREGTRWAVINRRSGAPAFLDHHGVPRLYGPVLMQAETSALTLQHVEHRRVVRLPNQGNLTTVAISTAGDTSSRVLVATGDIFGMVELLNVDFLTGNYETVLSTRTAASDGQHSSVVYGVHLEIGEPSQLIVLHGNDPQVLETLDIPTGRVRLRHLIPEEYRLVSPPAVHKHGDSMVVFGLRNALLFVDLREDVLWTIPVDSVGAFVGIIPVTESILALVSSLDGDTVLSLRETPRSAEDAVTWRFPGVYPAATDRGLLIVDTDERFIALEIAQ